MGENRNVGCPRKDWCHGYKLGDCQACIYAAMDQTRIDTARLMQDRLKGKAQILYNSVGVSFLAVDVAEIDRIVRELLGGEQK